MILILTFIMKAINTAWFPQLTLLFSNSYIIILSSKEEYFSSKCLYYFQLSNLNIYWYPPIYKSSFTVQIKVPIMITNFKCIGSLKACFSLNKSINILIRPRHSRVKTAKKWGEKNANVFEQASIKKKTTLREYHFLKLSIITWKGH